MLHTPQAAQVQRDGPPSTPTVPCPENYCSWSGGPSAIQCQYGSRPRHGIRMHLHTCMHVPCRQLGLLGRSLHGPSQTNYPASHTTWKAVPHAPAGITHALPHAARTAPASATGLALRAYPAFLHTPPCPLCPVQCACACKWTRRTRSSRGYPLSAPSLTTCWRTWCSTWWCGTTSDEGGAASCGAERVGLSGTWQRGCRDGRRLGGRMKGSYASLLWHVEIWQCGDLMMLQ